MQIHDTFVDTSWPECPHATASNPLWYRDNSWYCDHLEEPVARLGELAPSAG